MNIPTPVIYPSNAWIVALHLKLTENLKTKQQSYALMAVHIIFFNIPVFSIMFELNLEKL